MARNYPATTLSLVELMRMFSTRHKCMVWPESVLWPDGKPVCPRCKTQESIYTLKTKFHYQCRACARSFAVTTGTAMHATKLHLQDWIIAMYMMVTARKGVSALQLSKELGIAHKTAWHLMHRIRHSCMRPAGKLSGVIQAAETYEGGKQKNKHKHKKAPRGQGGNLMSRIVGLREEGSGQIRLLLTPDRTHKSIQKHILDNVEEGSTLYTDEHRAYKALGKFFRHKAVNHGKKQWRFDGADVNSMESVWASTERALMGTYHHTKATYKPLYLREFEFRYNQGNCKTDTLDRLTAMAAGLAGSRFSWAMLQAFANWETGKYVLRMDKRPPRPKPRRR